MKPSDCLTTAEVNVRKTEKEVNSLVRSFTSGFDYHIERNGIDSDKPTRIWIAAVNVDESKTTTESAISRFVNYLQNEGWKDVSYVLEEIPGELEDETLFHLFGLAERKRVQDSWEKNRRHFYVIVKRPS